MAQDQDPVYAVLNQFLDYALTKKDVDKAASLVTEDFYFLGASKAVFGKEEFRKLLEQEKQYVDKAVLYRIIEYHSKPCGDTAWSCFGQVVLTVEGAAKPEEEYEARMTANVIAVDGTYRISVLHRTMLKSVTQREENFPFRIITTRVDRLDQASRRELLNLLCETMPNGIIGGYMEEGWPVYIVNDTFLELIGYTYEEFIKETDGNVLNRIWEEDRKEALESAEKQCREKGEYEIEYRMRKKDGTFLWVFDRGRRITTQDGKEAVISLIIDISENVKMKNNLFVESVTDPLTGLYNRRGGEIMVSQRLESGEPYIFLMMDIDCFKAVNDIYGHHEGDCVLKYTAGRLKHFFRRDDVIIRMGGDEFVIFVHPCTSISAIENKLMKISTIYKEKMKEYYPASGSSLSFGGVYCDRPVSFVELYKKADRILYEIKQKKKGEFRIEDWGTKKQQTRQTGV
nr:diguanylate cyclase [uncultured Sellimonas sp.]